LLVLVRTKITRALARGRVAGLITQYRFEDSSRNPPAYSLALRSAISIEVYSCLAYSRVRLSRPQEPEFRAVPDNGDGITVGGGEGVSRFVAERKSRLGAGE